MKRLGLLKSKRILAWVLLALGVLVLGLFRFFIGDLPSEAATPPFLDVWLRLWIFLLIGIGLFCFYQIKDVELRADLISILLGVALGGLVLLGLKNTSYALNGVNGDAGFQTAQVTKFAAYSRSVDFAYKDLPAFYPPLYFYILGRIAALLNIEPYRMMKYGLVTIVYILPFLARKFWSFVLPSIASIVAVLSVFFFQNWYKPSEWLSLFLFLPWWLYFIEDLRRHNKAHGLLWYATGGLIGALIFTTYYYWFFIGGLSLLFHFVSQRTACGRSNRSRRNLWPQRLGILSGTAFFSLPYWGPYLASMWRTGGWVPLQNRYFIGNFTLLEFPFFALSITGILLLLGFAYLLKNYKLKPLPFALLNLLVAAYLWQFLGYVGFLLNSPLLSFKARDIVIYLLAVAALIAGVELWNWLQKSALLRQKWTPVFAGLAIALTFYFGQNLAADFARSDLLAPALEVTYPADLINGYEDAVRSNDFDRVILGDTSVAELSIYLPVYQFLPPAAHYSHPAGLYGERVAFLQALSRAENPAWFAAALMNNRYSHIDELILVPAEGGYRLGYRPDQFPYSTTTENIFFPSNLFGEAYFTPSPLEGYILLSPQYKNNPLAGIDVDLEHIEPSTQFGEIGDADDMLEFLERFGKYLDFGGAQKLKERLNDLIG